MRRLLKKKKLLSRRKTDFVEKKSIGIGGNLWYNWLRCPRGHLRFKKEKFIFMSSGELKLLKR